MPRRPRILVLAGTARGDSPNGRLAALAVKLLALGEADVTRISLADYPLPILEADDAPSPSVPEAAASLARTFAAHQGVLVVSPEYNASVSPLLKNALDWVSRVRERPARGASGRVPAPFAGRVFALAAASEGDAGGLLGLLHLRQILELGLGAPVLPEQLTLAAAGAAFDDGGALRDERAAETLGTMLRRLVQEAERYA